MITNEFKKAYESLNREQKRAVDTIEGPVMVIAGPGTGKTQVLTLRIANILAKTDTRPENILALTFTEAAATNMRRRLARLIGSSAYRVRIETFHSFCNDIIKTYPESFSTIIGSTHITEVEGAAILEELIVDLPLSILRPWGDPLFYLRDIGSKISELKREGIAPDEYSVLVRGEESLFKGRTDLEHEKGAYKGKMKSIHIKFERQISKNKELALIYEAYQNILHERRLYDWSDMIMEVLRALRDDKHLKLSLQEEHQYILVDEHQDTNNAQNKIVELLSDFHENPNVFIVGDEKQAIFRFQGASVENFLFMKSIYPGVEIIQLSENYRSVQPILDAAHSLLSSETPLHSQQIEEGPSIYLAECENKTSELYLIAHEIKKSIERGIAPSEIAVLYRNNKDAFAMRDMLDKQGVSYAIESDEDLLSEPFVRVYIALLDALYHYGEDTYLIPVLHIDEFGIDPLVAYKIIATASRQKKSVYECLEMSNDNAAQKLGKKLREWSRYAHSKTLLEVLERGSRESGLLNSMLQSKDADVFLGIERLFEEGKRIALTKPEATLATFMEYLTILRTHKIFVRRPKHFVRPGHVRLMTAHRSKGLEFEEVFIIHASEDVWGKNRSVDYLPLLPAVYRTISKTLEYEGNILEDERRLFYVALTRARSRVVISYPTLDENGRELLPSIFIGEIRSNLIERLDIHEVHARLKNEKGLLYAAKLGNGSKEIDKHFIEELFLNQPLSVTALNNYLECPWKYFYRNLLRIPSIPEKHQLYGTAMHAAVQDLFLARKERDVDATFLLESYKRHLGNSSLANYELTEALERGSEALTGWFITARPLWKYPAIPEFSITTHLDDIVLQGKLDKVEFLNDSRVIVTDYKTGKPKSRNEIEGITKSAMKNGGGAIKRQLIFYNLLLDLYDGGKFKMDRGVIEFLEPNDTGIYKREEFEVSESDRIKLTEIIKQMAVEVKSLAFWNTHCDEKECEYCSYRKMLQK